MKLHQIIGNTTKKILLWSLLLLVVLSPLPLGSNRPEFWNVICFITATLGLLSLIQIKDFPLYNTPTKIAAAFCFATVIFIWLQTQQIYLPWQNSIWSKIEISLPVTASRSITIHPYLTFDALTKYLSYIIVFWCAMVTSRSRQTAWRMIELVAYAGLLYATYGIIEYFTGNSKILWHEKWAYHNSLTSVFVNRNTYATFTGMVALCATSVLWRLSYRLDGRPLRSVLFSERRLFWRLYLMSLCLISNLAALFLTHSRGGFLATAFGFTVFIGIVLAKQKRISLSFLLGLIAVIIILSFSIIFSGEVTFARLASTSFETSIRDDVYGSILEGVWASPILGWGFGTFEESFQAFVSEKLGVYNWDKAHNTYLEVIFELGIIFGCFFFMPFILICQQFTRAVVNKRRKYMLPALGISILGLSAVHALVDFSHQIPAIAIFFSWIMGVTLTHSNPKKR